MADLNKLRSILNSSKIQNENNALYQVISEMLYALIGISRSLIIRAAEENVVFPGGGTEIGTDLDYLGDYVSGPLYNDGDIVVATDGIAYICVKPTNTPPEMWPGVGLATAVGPPGPPGPPGPAGSGGIVDATYWTATAHAGLTNERALNSLANGYVKSTAGEPSTVALIPISDTTGTVPDARLSSNVALKNIDNGFVAQTFAVGSVVQGTNAYLYFRDTSSPVDFRVWRTIVYGDGNFRLEALNDAISIVKQQYIFYNNGYFQALGLIGDGANLSNLNASNLATGIVNTARLGSGTANSTTFLRGDGVWAVPITVGVVSGSIIFFTTPCPPGYTRVAVWDGYYVRMGPAHVAGGANSHQHGVGSYSSQNHTHGIGSYATAAHSHSAGGLSVDSHNHGTVSISGSAASAGAHTHPFDTTLGGSTGGESAGIMNVDAGSSGNMTRGPHTHSLSGVAVSGTTDSNGAHTHTVSGSGSTGNASPGVSGNTGTTGSAGAITGASGSAGAGAITGASDIQNNMPLYIDFFACMKD